MSDTWQLQDAKNRFSELVDRALKDGSQVVTRHGRRVVVVLPYDEYERMTQPEDNLAEFLLKSPLAGAEIEIDRDASKPRDVDIEP
jgi:prevent-host-death family protein